MSNSQWKVTLEKHAYILFSLSQCYFYELARVVLSLWVGSGRQAVMLQGFIISGWERCPFATMASLVFHASSSQFQALQPNAAGGLSCVLCSGLLPQVKHTVPLWMGPRAVPWAAAQVVSPSSALSGKGFSGTCLCKNTVELCSEISFPTKTRWRNIKIFLNIEGCNLS